MVSIDLKKAYDMVPRDLIWWVLKKTNISIGYIEIIKDMYEGAIKSEKYLCRDREIPGDYQFASEVNPKSLFLCIDYG